MIQIKPVLYYTATDVTTILRDLLEMEHKEKENFDEYAERYEE